MAIQPLIIPTRIYGESTKIAPDVNDIVDKVDELVDAVNAGLATSNVIVGGDKYVQYLSSKTYGVPADALTLDRLDPSTILPGTEATVINPHPTPLTATAASAYYRATIVPAGTAGAVLVPAFTGSLDKLPIAWVEVVDNSSFTPLLANEVNVGKAAYTGLELRPLLIAIVNGIGTGSSTVVTTPATQAPATGPTVTGFLPDSAAEGASVTLTGSGFTKATAVLFNGTPASFQLVNATTLVAVVPVGATTGPVAVTNAAGTGTSTASFTVKATVVVTPPTPTPDLAAALAISLASVTLGSPVAFSVTPSGGTSPYAYEVVATDNGTGQQFTLGTTSSGSWTPTVAGSYGIQAKVTDSSSPAKVASSAIRYLQVVQATNRIPVADAGQDVTLRLPTSSVALMGSASDPDPGDTLTYAWRQITGPNSASGLPAATLNVVVSGLVAGTYQLGFRSTDNHGAQSVEDYTVITVLAQGQAYTISPQTGDYQGNAGIADTQSDGTVRRASLAFLEYDVTDEPSVGLTIKTNGAKRVVSALLDGQLLQRWESTGAGTNTYNLSLPGSGKRRLKVVLGRGDRDFEAGDIIAPSVLSLSFPGMGSTALYKATPDEEVLGLGDSIMSGADATTPETEAAVVLLRTPTRGYTASAYGSHTGAVALGTADARNRALQECNVTWARPGVIKTLDISLLTNDYGLGTATPLDVATGIAIFLDMVYAAHPTARVWLYTPFNRFDLTGARRGYTLQDWRDAEMQVVIGREHFAKIIDGPSILVESDLSPTDKLHPTSGGQQKVAAKKNADFNNRVFAAQASGPVVLPPPGRRPVASGLPPNWQTQRGFDRLSLSGNTLTHAPTAANGWNCFAPAFARLKSLPAGVTGEVLRIEIPSLTRATGAVIVGLFASPAITNRYDVAGFYADNYQLGLDGGDDKLVAGYINGYPDPLGKVFLVAAVSAPGQGYMEIRREDGTSIAGRLPFTFNSPLYIYGFCYGNAGWDVGQDVSTLKDLIITNDYLEEAFA